MSKAARSTDRDASFRDEGFRRAMAAQAYDVVIIGGGVNGVATFRDLCLNGIATLLIDEKDFCAGASSASSRMAHGGLRYLESREFRLVRESARERNLLLRHAAHLVKPLPIIVPVRAMLHGFATSVLRFLGAPIPAGPLSAAALKGALQAYELMGQVDNILPHHRLTLNKAAFSKGFKRGTKAVAKYYDGLIVSPEGLVHEMLAEGVASQSDSAALNYVSWSTQDGALEIADGLSAQKMVVRPSVIINATGAHIDKTNEKLGLGTSYVRNVKGAHLVLKNQRLSDRLNGNAHYYDDGHGRMVIMIPLGATILMGTTEIDVKNLPRAGEVSADEVDYLLGAATALFDDIEVTKNDIVALTTGVRPLRAGGGSDPNRALRDHAICMDHLPAAKSVPVLSLVGGKWTTFRAFGQDATNKVLSILGAARKVQTHNRDYPGAMNLEAQRAEIIAQSGVARGAILFKRYGSIGHDVAQYCAQTKDTPLKHFTDYSTGEIAWLVRSRGACQLDDMVLRRTDMVVCGKMTHKGLAEVAEIMARALGHDAQWVDQQVKKCAAMPTILAPQIAQCEETSCQT